MVFSGEGAWRWRMQMATDDRTYELFWRQAVRWTAGAADEPITIGGPSHLMPGETGDIEVLVRDRTFAPVPDAVVTMQVTSPSGGTRSVRAMPAAATPAVAAAAGRFSVPVTFDEAGIYECTATARRREEPLATAASWVLVGGVDREMADPRLNEDVLRRLSSGSGGTYRPAVDAESVVDAIDLSAAAPPSPRTRDIWNNTWVFVALVTLFSAEWALRRQWGLR